VPLEHDLQVVEGLAELHRRALARRGHEEVEGPELDRRPLARPEPVDEIAAVVLARLRPHHDLDPAHAVGGLELEAEPGRLADRRPELSPGVRPRGPEAEGRRPLHAFRHHLAAEAARARREVLAVDRLRQGRGLHGFLPAFLQRRHFVPARAGHAERRLVHVPDLLPALARRVALRDRPDLGEEGVEARRVPPALGPLPGRLLDPAERRLVRRPPEERPRLLAGEEDGRRVAPARGQGLEVTEHGLRGPRRRGGLRRRGRRARGRNGRRRRGLGHDPRDGLLGSARGRGEDRRHDREEEDGPDRHARDRGPGARSLRLAPGRSGRRDVGDLPGRARGGLGTGGERPAGRAPGLVVGAVGESALEVLLPEALPAGRAVDDLLPHARSPLP